MPFTPNPIAPKSRDCYCFEYREAGRYLGGHHTYIRVHPEKAKLIADEILILNSGESTGTSRRKGILRKLVLWDFHNDPHWRTLMNISTTMNPKETLIVEGSIPLHDNSVVILQWNDAHYGERDMIKLPWSELVAWCGQLARIDSGSAPATVSD